MMTVDEMNSIKEKLGLTYQTICRESGVPIGTIQKVLSGTTKNPRAETMWRLEKALTGLKQGHDMYYRDYFKRGHNTPVLCESMHVYKSGSAQNTAQREPHLITVSERDALTDDRRTELIDGVLYDMSSPSMPHQDICKAVCAQIDRCITEHHSGCHSFMAPADVCLDRDEYTVVQPDVFVVCDKKQISRKNIQGAPAFILEVMSPSTRKMDKDIKFWKYLHAGVSEYWIIDPETKQVVVFDMTDKRSDVPDEEGSAIQADPYQVAIYGFTDRIPLAISNGTCIIDMNPIREMLEELY